MRNGQMVLQAVDTSLEKVDLFLDDYLGLNKRDRLLAADTAKKQATSTKVGSRKRNALMMMKPQRKFKNKPDNSEAPWFPILKEKLNALVPWNPNALFASASPDLGPVLSSHVLTLGSSAIRAPTVASLHPYEFELNNFKFGAQHMSPVKERIYGALSEVCLLRSDC